MGKNFGELHVKMDAVVADGATKKDIQRVETGLAVLQVTVDNIQTSGATKDDVKQVAAKVEEGNQRMHELARKVDIVISNQQESLAKYFCAGIGVFVGLVVLIKM